MCVVLKSHIIYSNKLKWIVSLRAKSRKFLEENIGANLSDRSTNADKTAYFQRGVSESHQLREPLEKELEKLF